MQDIATKLSRIATATKAAGLTEQQARHLIHGTGGSPRRARRAIRLGIHEQLIDAYDAALTENGSHAKALVACNALWAELVPSDTGDHDADEANDEATAAVAAETVAKAARPAARRTRRVASPAAEPSAADLKALLPA